MNLLNLVGLLSGLALFLYGVSLMGDGLRKLAGDKLRKVLYHYNGSHIMGILLGVGITAVMQSSSATSMMAIGFVNSGLMHFKEAVSIILGSLVGTSITGWLASLSSLGQKESFPLLLSAAFLTGALAITGIVLYKFSKKPGKNHLGSVLLGFAVLLFGMSTMSGVFATLRENELFTGFLTKLSNPFVGIVVGILFTALIRSSAGATGLLQALSMTGPLPFSAAFPAVLGIAVGGAFPVLLSSRGASINARRTALIHLMINVIGALFCGIVFYAVHAARPFSIMTIAMNPIQIAVLNTVFRLACVVVLTPMIDGLGKIACRIIKDEPQEKNPETAGGDWDLLDDRFLSHPAIAIEQSRIVLFSMAAYVRENLEKATALIHAYSEEEFRQVQELEEMIDHYEDKIGTYLVKVSSSKLTTRQNEDLYEFLHAITDLERISDHATNISENAKELHDKKIELSPDAVADLNVIQSAVEEVLDLSLRALTEQDEESAHMVEPLEERIDNLSDEIKHRHVERLQKGACTLQHGFVFNDLITNFERISDHCSNLAVAKIELEQDAFDTHDYIDSLMDRKDEKFAGYYDRFKEKYTLS